MVSVKFVVHILVLAVSQSEKRAQKSDRRRNDSIINTTSDIMIRKITVSKYPGPKGWFHNLENIYSVSTYPNTNAHGPQSVKPCSQKCPPPCPPPCPPKTECPAVGIQNALVSVPVTIVPFANKGPVKVFCCGDPVINYNTDRCCGKVNDVCRFIITQQLKVEVPVDFGADVCVGDSFVCCEGTETAQAGSFGYNYDHVPQCPTVGNCCADGTYR